MDAAQNSKRITATAEIVNARGLHARASAKFVETVVRFPCEVTVSKDGTSVSGRSIMGLMMLGAGKGSTISLAAEGPEAEAAMKALLALIRARFYEDQ